MAYKLYYKNNIFDSHWSATIMKPPQQNRKKKLQGKN